MKAVVAAFNQEKALVGAFSVITNLRMELFEALPPVHHDLPASLCLITIITRAPARGQVALDGGDWWVGNLKIIDTNRCST